MKRKNIGVIGCGRWGKVIIKELNKISNIKFIYNSKDDYKKISENIDWIFILTPDKTHYKIAKHFLEKKINVFCEKPLTIDFKKADYLINLSKKLKTNLYVDDVEIYKKKHIKINNKINNIVRTKKDLGTAKSLLNRLAYHDFYLIFQPKDLNMIKYIEANTKKKILKIKITLQNKTIFNFLYDIGSNKKKHFINKIRMDKFTNNPVKDMLKTVLYKKNNFKKNNINALTSIKLINKVRDILK
jgi:hypothetical protein